MTDREVQAISQFLREFGYLGCFDIAQRRADRAITKMSEEQVAQKVLDILPEAAAARARGLGPW